MRVMTAVDVFTVSEEAGALKGAEERQLKVNVKDT